MKAIPMRDAFLELLWQEMGRNDNICFVTADFGSPVLDKIRSDFPDRCYNVGIAEQNLINVTAGLALEGFIVVAYAIAPFITMRCYEQIRISLALLSNVRSMNVCLVGVGAGCSYTVSGPSHQCYEDITLMRALPNFKVFSPSDHVITECLFKACIGGSGLKYMRLDAQVLDVLQANPKFEQEKGFRQLQDGLDGCVIATGYMTGVAIDLVDQLRKYHQLNLSLIDLVDLSHCSKALIDTLRRYSKLISIEEGFRGRGGLDALLFDSIVKKDSNLCLFNIGVTPGYRFELGTRDEIHSEVGLDRDSMVLDILKFCSPDRSCKVDS